MSCFKHKLYNRLLYEDILLARTRPSYILMTLDTATLSLLDFSLPPSGHPSSLPPCLHLHVPGHWFQCAERWFHISPHDRVLLKLML